MSGARASYRPAHRRRRHLRLSPAVVAVPAGIAGVAGLAVAASGAPGATSSPTVTPALTAGSLVARAPERPSRSSSRVPLEAREAPARTVADASRARDRDRGTEPRPRATPAAARAEPAPLPPATVVGTRYSSTGLNVRSGPSTDAAVVTTVAAGTTIEVTDRVSDGWRLVKVDGALRWVADEYLSRTKPEPQQVAVAAATGGLSAAPCASGSAVESGLVPNAVAVHRAVCAAFPQVTSFGGYRAGDGSYHGSGQAVDVMVSGALGDQIATWLQANAGTLGISELIWSQRIWTVQRAGEGWRWMPDRGSATANHYDHVHVSVY